MQDRKIGEIFKNAFGTVFLLAAAFFVCSTLISMRAVLADPVAPAQMTAPTAPSPRATNTSGRGTSRTTTAAPSRAGGAVVSPSRSVAMRSAPASRSVANRTNTNSRATSARTVISRVATTPNTVARVSLTGSAIRGSTGSQSSYTYLSNKLYTGNYSNIIDSTTGLISADAYANCLESYYTCMDEICTARNQAQRRCRCAGRVKTFAQAELALEQANEELIKASGELALLIANKGKDISSAFTLTEAEQVMNCVAWQDDSQNGTRWVSKYDTTADGVNWCTAHALYDQAEDCTPAAAKPPYCENNSFGFELSNLNGSGSDILATLSAWAKSKDASMTITTTNNENLLNQYNTIGNIVGNMSGLNVDTRADKDGLAETWGYDLFAYAHNNVCNRVLDSCFNGIYEACGNPGNGDKCNNGRSTCPYNFNSTVTVSGNNVDFVTAGGNSYTNANSATCFGYTSANGDPYRDLRGPVADARRSVLQKYALDANADCDAYGEQLRETAQNIGYQKAAAQQALQQKRLEFANAEISSTLANATAAGTNFNECLSEVYDCYETQYSSNPSWPTARIRTYCAQIANVPHCYQDMICNPSNAQFRAVIAVQDNEQCKWSQDPKNNTCRNVVTLNDILNAPSVSPVVNYPSEGDSENSVAIRERCLQDSFVNEIRNWTASAN